MANEFRPYEPDQPYLLPQLPREWLPEDHLALFIMDVVNELDLTPILSRYHGGRGPAGYHPRMLLTLLLYGYCTGVFSSRKIADRCHGDLAFRVLSASQFPDFRTISDFRKAHLDTFNKLFIDVLRLCREAGLLKMGHLSLDGSKYQANASKHKAMSYGRIKETEPELEAEVRELLRRAQAIDDAEDKEYGDRQGDELPEELARRETRLKKLREAKQRLEERARNRAREQAERRGATAEQAAAKESKAVPKDREQSNFTDPDSRIMKGAAGWVQGYNTQVLVDETSGVIVAEDVNGQSADSPQLEPILDQAERNLTDVGAPEGGRRPHILTADAGYCSEVNLARLEERGIDAYIATGRERHRGQGIEARGELRTPRRAAMRAKLQTEQGRAVYARRKAITEPVHGLIKQARGFRQFLLRGLGKVKAEFTLIALTHNLLKLWRAGLASA
jgi:transposase